MAKCAVALRRHRARRVPSSSCEMRFEYLLESSVFLSCEVTWRRGAAPAAGSKMHMAALVKSTMGDETIFIIFSSLYGLSSAGEVFIIQPPAAKIVGAHAGRRLLLAAPSSRDQSMICNRPARRRKAMSASLKGVEGVAACQYAAACRQCDMKIIV